MHQQSVKTRASPTGVIPEYVGERSELDLVRKDVGFSLCAAPLDFPSCPGFRSSELSPEMTEVASTTKSDEGLQRERERERDEREKILGRA